MTAAVALPPAFVGGDQDEVAALLPYLTPAERRELDGYLVTRTRIVKRPDGSVHIPPLAPRYVADPVAWAVDELGIPERTIRWSLNPGYERHRWDGTPDPLVAVAMALAAGKNAGVESGTGTGKTFEIAWLVLWFLRAFVNALVVTYASKEQQLTKGVWKEVGHLWPRYQRICPWAELSALRIRMRPDAPDRDKWTAFGVGCQVRAGEESATKAQGDHAEHMLLVYEEMPGIDPAIVVAGEQTSVDAHNLRLGVGNPDHQQDELHKWCVTPGVEHVRISALDHPNVVTGRRIVPGAVSREKIDERRRKYGEDSRLYQSRVRGISPKEASDALIRWDWCVRAARERTPEEMQRLQQSGPPALGVDVANSPNGDKAAIARWLGVVCAEVSSFPCPDANKLGARVAVEMRAMGIRPEHVGVDSVGVGSGTVNELTRLGYAVMNLEGGEDELEIEDDVARFRTLRAQMYWRMRMDLQHDRIVLPYDEELFQDLCAPKWAPDDRVIVVESKKDLKKRLGRSPDKGDACVYGNWVRQYGAVNSYTEGALVAL